MPKTKQFYKSEEDEGLVYFIGNAVNGPVKIGFTSHSDPRRRLKQLQTASPVELSVLGYIHGGIGLEQKIHGFLYNDRLKGEWFERKPALAILQHLGGGHQLDRNHLLSELDSIAWQIEINEASESDEPLAVTVARHLILDVIQTLSSCNYHKPLPLLGWLLEQCQRDDCVGDLAKDAALDEDFPSAASLSDYLIYAINVSGNPAVTRTIIDAWLECQQAVLRLKA